MIVKILVFVLLSVGFYMFAAAIFNLSPHKSVKALSITEEKLGFQDTILVPAAHFIENFIHLSEFRQNKLQQQLNYAGEKNMTPQFYIAYVIAHALKFAVLGLIILPFFPIGTAVLILFSVVVFFKNIKVNDSEDRRKNIESEIPRFTSYIVQNLSRKQDLTSIIRGYRDIAGKELKEELDTLIAGLQTRNHEAALIEFESTVNSPMMSQLVRGLLGIEAGDDMTVYLKNLEIRMDEHEVAALEEEAGKRPDKLTPASWLLLGSILVIYFTVMGVQLCSSLSFFN